MSKNNSNSENSLNPETENTISQEQRINLETARIGWQELQRYFAMGVLIVIEREMDLVSMASAFIDDDSDRIQSLMADRNLRKVGTRDAKRWNQVNMEFWAVVVTPWVLVQEVDQS